MRYFIVYTLALFSFASCMQPSRQLMGNIIKNDEAFAATQYKILMKNTPADKMPRYFDTTSNTLKTSSTEWWTSGFYPGSLWLIYKATGDTAILKEAERKLAILEKEKFYTGNHDIGFMIFCSFGTAYDITKNPAYKDVVLTAAESAIKRYRPSIQSIQSWDKNDLFNCPVIIDNMMNLELLEWASVNTGNDKYASIARNHANTTLKNHFRSDYSSYHVVDYDLKSGKLIAKKTYQGYNDASAWARGQAWALYGYTMMYRFTKNKQYLDQAANIAGFILNHPNLPADKIPYWDFNAPDIPNAKRDASAAAIMTSALLELSQYSTDKEKNKYTRTAAAMIESLSSKYKSPPGGQKGFILMHSVGNYPANSEIDTPLTYADYYYLEAMDRYKKWVLNR